MPERGSDQSQFDEESANAYKELPRDVSALVVLNKKKQPIPHRQGTPGEVQNGFSFYQLVLRKEGAPLEAHYVTSRIGEQPVLEAVSESQYKAWGKRKMIARPIRYIWSEEKGLWSIVETKQE